MKKTGQILWMILQMCLVVFVLPLACGWIIVNLLLPQFSLPKETWVITGLFVGLGMGQFVGMAIEQFYERLTAILAQPEGKALTVRHTSTRNDLTDELEELAYQRLNGHAQHGLTDEEISALYRQHYL